MFGIKEEDCGMFRYEVMEYPRRKEWLIYDTTKHMFIIAFKNKAEAHKHAISLNIKEELY